MEFRIAPLIFAILNTLFLCNCIMHINDASIKQGLIGLGIVILAIGASRSHHYYSKPFTVALYSLCGVCAIMAGYVLYHSYL